LVAVEVEPLEEREPCRRPVRLDVTIFRIVFDPKDPHSDSFVA